MALTRAQFLELGGKPAVVELPLPDGAGVVCLRAMTAKSRFELRRDMKGGDGTRSAANLFNFEARVAAATLCNEDGSWMFDGGPEALKKLAEQPAPWLEAIANKGLDISGLGENSGAEAEGNSGTIPSDGSLSD